MKRNRSFMNKLKRSGPSIKPCGSPAITSFNLLLFFFCQLRDSMSNFYEQYFFLSSPFNNDSSDSKRILSVVSPGLLNINDYLLAGSHQILSHRVLFRCHQSPRSTCVKFCGRFFILIKKFQFFLNQMLLNLIVLKFVPGILKFLDAW